MDSRFGFDVVAWFVLSCTLAGLVTGIVTGAPAGLVITLITKPLVTVVSAAVGFLVGRTMLLFHFFYPWMVYVSLTMLFLFFIGLLLP